MTFRVFFNIKRTNRHLGFLAVAHLQDLICCITVNYSLLPAIHAGRGENKEYEGGYYFLHKNGALLVVIMYSVLHTHDSNSEPALSPSHSPMTVSHTVDMVFLPCQMHSYMSESLSIVSGRTTDQSPSLSFSSEGNWTRPWKELWDCKSQASVFPSCLGLSGHADCYSGVQT